MVAVVMLVILRVTIGWHFLYEGVWKIKNADTFSARPFLTQAKGPLAPLFYAMVPDIDGRQRLNLKETGKLDRQRNPIVTSEAYAKAWADLKQKVVDDYNMSDRQAAEAEKLLALHNQSLESYLTENREDIEAYFGSLERFWKRRAAGTNRAAHEKKRIWDQQWELRSEVNVWLSELDQMAEDYQLALWDLLSDEQKARGPIDAPPSEAGALPSWIPLVKTRMELLDVAVTYGLTAIGVCLMVGFCTRLAALGGAAFLAFVLLTQPPWPTIYPPAPEVLGHALIVDLKFVEMIALVTLATLAVGRWGGLDFFLYRWIGRPILSRFRRNDDRYEDEI